MRGRDARTSRCRRSDTAAPQALRRKCCDRRARRERGTAPLRNSRAQSAEAPARAQTVLTAQSGGSSRARTIGREWRLRDAAPAAPGRLRCGSPGARAYGSNRAVHVGPADTLIATAAFPGALGRAGVVSRCVGPVAADGPNSKYGAAVHGPGRPPIFEPFTHGQAPAGPGGRAPASALRRPHVIRRPGATLGPERGTTTLPGPAPGRERPSAVAAWSRSPFDSAPPSAALRSG